MTLEMNIPLYSGSAAICIMHSAARTHCQMAAMHFGQAAVKGHHKHVLLLRARGSHGLGALWIGLSVLGALEAEPGTAHHGASSATTRR